MKVLQEITQWPDNTRNHTYWVTDGGKVVAYDRGQGKETFQSPKNFDRRGRKFITLRIIDDPVTLQPGQRLVAGSQGNQYLVDDQAGTCTCSGFKFRGQCRHLETK